MTVNQIPPFEPLENYRDYHATVTITLGELVEGKWIDFNDETWQWNYYDEAQYNRVNNMIVDHYYNREIGVLPPLAWKREFLRKMNELMAKYSYVYKALDDGASLLQNSNTYGKNRSVFSDFPATQIAPKNEDYASNANDTEFENMNIGNMLDIMEKLKTVDAVDVALVNGIDSLFSCLISVNLNI